MDRVIPETSGHVVGESWVITAIGALVASVLTLADFALLGMI